MREMLAVTGAIKGAGLGKDVLLLTDGRFSGGTTGPVHRARRAGGGRRRADRASCGTATGSGSTWPPAPSTCWSTTTELARRREGWEPLPPRYTTGVLGKYAKLVGSAAQGAICG